MQCPNPDLKVRWTIRKLGDGRRRKRQDDVLVYEGKQVTVEPHTFQPESLMEVELKATLGEETLAETQSYFEV